MLKKKTQTLNPWTSEDVRELKAHSKARTPVAKVAKNLLCDRKTRRGVVRILDREVDDATLRDVKIRKVQPPRRDGQRNHGAERGLARVRRTGERVYSAPLENAVDRVVKRFAFSLEVDGSMDLCPLFVAGRDAFARRHRRGAVSLAALAEQIATKRPIRNPRATP